jgi:hypothetical protein
MRRKLQVADLKDLLEQPLNAILSMHLPSGEMLLTAVWHEWKDGGFSAVILANDVKDRNLRRDPRANIIVAENGGINRGIEVRGIARLSYDDADEVNQSIVQRYLAPARADLFLRELEGLSLVHVRLEPGRLRVWDFADDEAFQ